MRKIDIKECQELLLKIAIEIDNICKRHDIPFYMLGGTMLGAIRHKGFIPWDDDMDFGVPYDRYEELIKILREELPAPYVCSTFEESPAMLSYFVKVEDTSTVVQDVRVDLPLEEQQGLTVDVFPLVKCNEDEWKQLVPKIHSLQLLNRRVYIGSTDRKAYKRIAKRILKTIFPISSKQINRKIGRLIKKIQPGNFYCNVVSPHFWSVPLPDYYLDDKVTYPFETTNFLGISNFDEYLTKLYKDYMKLPPKEKQEVHLDNVFSKK